MELLPGCGLRHQLQIEARLHPSLLPNNSSIEAHNQTSVMVNATKKGDNAGAKRALNKLTALINSPFAEQFDQNVTAYCGSNYGINTSKLR
jgi:hypothetical protein